MALISYRRQRFPPVVIQHAVWLYLGKQHRLKSEHVLDGALVIGCRFVGE
jgi:hypothetical protein